MATKAEYRKALAEVAKNAGVSIEEVEASYRKCVKKSAASLADLFLADSVITLRPKKSFCAGWFAGTCDYCERCSRKLEV